MIKTCAIIGFGRMGENIANQLIDRVACLIIIVRRPESCAGIRRTIEKCLKRKQRKRQLTKEKAQSILDALTISTDISAAKNSDLVIETITENLASKQDVFKQLNNAVSHTCILTTNTSSLAPEDVFISVDHKERCFGLHYFYPIEWSHIVEVSRLPLTDDQYITQVEPLIDQTLLVLPAERPLILTYFLCLFICHAYNYYQQSSLSAVAFDAHLKEELCQFGPLEIVDNTGFAIIIQSLQQFTLERDDVRRRLLTDLHKIVEAQDATIADRDVFISYLASEVDGNKKLASPMAKDEIIRRLRQLVDDEVQHIAQCYNMDHASLAYAVREALKLHA